MCIRDRGVFGVYGIATGLSVKRAASLFLDDFTVRIGFTAENMSKVAIRRRGSYVIADNDEKGAGEKYAVKTGLPYWMPDEVGTDANDYEQEHTALKLSIELHNMLLDA